MKTRRKRTSGWLLLLVAGLAVQPALHPAAAHAAGGNTWYVATTGTNPVACPSAASTAASPLQTISFALTCAAADAAPANNPDTIQVAANTASVPSYAGGLTINQNVILTGAGPASTTISGGGPVITVSSGSTVTIQALTITGGQNGSGNGGGILNSGTLTVLTCTVKGNSASSGGGIANFVGSLTVTNSTVGGTTPADANSATTGGGGIYDYAGPLSVMGSTISGNSASYYAGGIWNNGGYTTTITNSTISGNSSAGDGGGIQSDNGNILNLVNSTVSGNTSRGNGGGILSNDQASITGSTISGNTAGTNVNTSQGGGIAFGGGGTQIMTMVNSTVGGNTASGLGGGMAIRGGATPTLVNVTISGNQAAQGGGIAAISGGSAQLSNTLLAGNTFSSGGSAADCSDVLTDGSGGHNVLGIADGCDTSGLTNHDQMGSAASPLAPRLGPLASNGGPTQTMALLAGSPALNNGDPTTCSTPPVSDLDQRGFPRNTSSRTACDIGAYDSNGQPLHVILMTPIRVLDTRFNTGGYSGLQCAGTTLTLTLAGTHGIYPDAVGIVGTLRAYTPTDAGYLTVYPGTGSPPTASNLNYTAPPEPSYAVSDAVTVGLDGSGKLSIYVGGIGCTQVVLDIFGYIEPGSEISLMTPTRVLDTRTSTGGYSGQQCAGTTLTLTLAGSSGIPSTAVGIIGTLRATAPTAAGYLTAYAGTGSPPTASNLNFTSPPKPSYAMSDEIVVGLQSGKMSIYVGGVGCTQVVLDVSGYLASTSEVHLLTPLRVLDTRNGTGGYHGPQCVGTTLTLTLAGSNGVPVNATGIIGTLRAYGPSDAGYLTMYPGAGARPVASNLNFTLPPAPSYAVSDAVTVGLQNGQVSIYVGGLGCTDIVFDISGYTG